jgi:hypothetical protein
MTLMPYNCQYLPYYGRCCSCSSTAKMPSKTSMEWALENAILTEGAFAYESDTNKWKLGNGIHRYQDLQYQAEVGDPGRDGAVGPAGPAGIQGVQGPAGAAAPTPVITIGTVTTGTTASATITGTAPNFVLNLVLPRP